MTFGHAKPALFSLQNIRDPSARMPVAIRVACVRHRRIGVFIFKQFPEIPINVLLVRTDDPERARLDSLGALGSIPHDENRLSETRRFLLNAAAVGQYQITARKEVMKIKHIERFDEVYAVTA